MRARSAFIKRRCGQADWNTQPIERARPDSPCRRHGATKAVGERPPSADRGLWILNIESCEPPIKLRVLLEKVIGGFLKRDVRAIEQLLNATAATWVTAIYPLDSAIETAVGTLGRSKGADTDS